MGLLSDFVIADAGSGPAIGESHHPADTWPTFKAKGMDMIKLASLYCAITGETYHNDIQASFQLVGGNKEEGPWVFEFPSEILQAIAGIGASEIRRVAENWSETEGLRMDRWTAESACSFIEAISAHAKGAVASSRSMYLWLAI